jgi:hypothetical protein
MMVMMVVVMMVVPVAPLMAVVVVVMVMVVRLRHLHVGPCRLSRALAVDHLQQGSGVRNGLEQIGIGIGLQDIRRPGY